MGHAHTYASEEIKILRFREVKVTGLVGAELEFKHRSVRLHNLLTIKLFSSSQFLKKSLKWIKSYVNRVLWTIIQIDQLLGSVASFSYPHQANKSKDIMATYRKQSINT